MILRPSSRGVAVAWVRLGALTLFLCLGLAQSGSPVGTLLLAAIWAVSAVGLALVLGFARQPVLCQGAFMLVGAYAYGWVASPSQVGWDPVVAMVVGVVTAAALAWVSSPVMHLRGFTLAIGTIALGLLIQRLLRLGDWLPGGELGILDVPPLGVAGASLTTRSGQLLLVSAILCVLLLLLGRQFGRGARRRALEVVGVDEELASSLGLDPAGQKRMVFIISGAVAGLAGALHASVFGFVQPDSFGPLTSFGLAVAVIIGARDRLAGAVVGALVFEFSDSFLGSQLADLRPAVLGAVVIASVHLFPRGLLPSVGELLPVGVERQIRSAFGSRRSRLAGDRMDEERMARERSGSGGDDRRQAPRAAGLRVEAGERAFDGCRALDGVDLTVPPAALVAVIGPNGAGKTTLLAAIAGDPLDRGVVDLRGVDVTGLPGTERSRLGVARTYQHPRLVESLNIRDNVMLGADARTRRADRRLDQDADSVVRDALDRAGLLEVAERSVSSVDLAGRRLVELARVAAARPALALLDEPSSGLDDADASRVVGFIRWMNAAPCTVLLVEHDLEFVGSLAHEVHAVAGGRVVASGSLDEVLGCPEFRRLYFGSSTRP